MVTRVGPTSKSSIRSEAPAGTRAALSFLVLLWACGGSKPEPQSPGNAHQGHGEHHAHGGEHHGHHGHKGPLVHDFKSADQWAGNLERPDRAAWQKPEHVIELLAIEPGMIIADIGAGTGYFLPYLSRAAGKTGKVLGLDIELDMVRYMNERIARDGLTNTEARAVKLDDPLLAPASVDRVLLVNTWHHISGRSPYAAKLAAALREGGAIYIVDFTMESQHGPPKHHRLRAETVIEELKAAGLVAEVVAEELPEQYVVVARRAK